MHVYNITYKLTKYNIISEKTVVAALGRREERGERREERGERREERGERREERGERSKERGEKTVVGALGRREDVREVVVSPPLLVQSALCSLVVQSPPVGSITASSLESRATFPPAPPSSSTPPSPSLWCSALSSMCLSEVACSMCSMWVSEAVSSMCASALVAAVATAACPVAMVPAVVRVRHASSKALW